MVIFTEQSFGSRYESLSPSPLAYFKLILIGEKTLRDNSFDGNKLCNLMKDIFGFFILADNKEEMKKELYNIIDRFCDSVYKESDNGK